MKETVLVVGGAGYIGTALVDRLLKDTKYKVRVLDSLLYGGDSLIPFFKYRDRFSFVKADIRYAKLDDHVRHIDYVVNLAALVGEPICKQYPVEATDINLKANIMLAEACERNGVLQYIYSSTCSNYGLAKDENPIDEDGELQPISLYAETKVKSELKLLTEFKRMHVTVLRFATAFGLSQRVRFDLLLHQFIRDAWKEKKIVVYGGNAWRPIVHVDDIARAIMTCVGQWSDKAEVYNVGSNDQNYRKIELADMVAKRFGATVQSLNEIKDARSYKVSFDRINKKFGYVTQSPPEETIDQIAHALETGIITDRILYESVNMKGE